MDAGLDVSGLTGYSSSKPDDKIKEYKKLKPKDTDNLTD